MRNIWPQLVELKMETNLLYGVWQREKVKFSFQPQTSLIKNAQIWHSLTKIAIKSLQFIRTLLSFGILTILQRKLSILIVQWVTWKDISLASQSIVVMILHIAGHDLETFLRFHFQREFIADLVLLIRSLLDKLTKLFAAITLRLSMLELPKVNLQELIKRHFLLTEMLTSHTAQSVV